MPVITLQLDKAQHQRLFDEFKRFQAAPTTPDALAASLSFENWLAQQFDAEPSSRPERDDIRLFATLEKLVTSLHQHDFALAHLARHGDDSAKAAAGLSAALVKDANLPALYQKRIQELFAHYLKTAKEVADSAHVGITNRAYGAITEAYRHVVERTRKSLPGLDSDRAIGRVEGAAAVLVTLEVMDRAGARLKTEVFKSQMPTQPKSNWVDKVFRAPRGKE